MDLPDLLGNSWIVAILQGVLGSAIFAILVIVIEPIRTAVINLSKWLKLVIYNPELNVEIAISSEIDEIDCQKFISIIKKVLLETTGNQPIQIDDMLQTNKNFENYSIEIFVSPISHSESASIYDYFTIIIKFESLRLRKLNRGLLEAQNFLFKDMITAFYREFGTFNPIIEKESVSVRFNKKPSMLNSLKDLNIDTINSREDEVDILLTENKIKFTGNLSNPIFLKFENLIKQNLTS